MLVEILDSELEKDCNEIEMKLAHLLCEGVIFCNNGWFKDKWPKDYITLHVNCNDVFAWACADAEDVTYHEVSELYEMYKKDPCWGPAAWCIKKRKQMPQSPVEKRIKEQGIWNLEELIKNES